MEQINGIAPLEKNFRIWLNDNRYIDVNRIIDETDLFRYIPYAEKRPKIMIGLCRLRQVDNYADKEY